MMVSGIKAGTLEDDPDGLVDLLQSLLFAFRAAGERLVTEGLLLIELHTAIVTTIGVNWHGLLLSQIPLELTNGEL